MSYQRVTPRARVGTTGISEEVNIETGQKIWINPPERIAAVTVAVHIPAGETAQYTVEICANRTETIGENGTGGYWDNIYGENAVMTTSETLMLANSITGIRVNCIEASSFINVCFVG